MSNPIKMTLAELLECNPLDVAKWAIREGDKLCTWQEPTEKDQISVFTKEKGHKERLNSGPTNMEIKYCCMNFPFM